MSWLSLVISILKEHSVCRMGCNDWKLIFYDTEIEVSTSKPVEMNFRVCNFITNLSLDLWKVEPRG